MADAAVSAVFETDLQGVPLKARGKVRDVYDLGNLLLIVSTDRLSAFDHVLPNPIPGKGRVLNQMSEFWFKRLESLIPNNLISTDVMEFPDPLPAQAAQIEGRSPHARERRHRT